MAVKTMVVVGAGGTLSDAIHAGVDPGSRPPLDRGFFSQAKNTDKKQFSMVQQYCKEQYGLDITGPTDNSLEAVLGMLYTDSYRGGEIGTKAFRAFRALVGLLLKELARTTNPLQPTENDFILRTVDRLLTSGESASDIGIATFNYDLHIERSLELLSKRRGEPNLLHFPNCYKLKPLECTHPKAGPDNCFDMGPAGGAGIPILKLHGSLNWYSGHLTANISRASLFKVDKTIRITRRRQIDTTMTYTTTNGKTLHTFPVVVPPVLNKAGVLPTDMKPLWQIAEEALREAEEVIIMGYSCPPADLESANMFRRAFRTAARQKRLHVIDPNPTVLMRYVELTDAGALSYYKSADSFFQQWVPMSEELTVV